MLSPHETLKVAPDATQAEIQQAYRSWSKLVHPDRVDPELKEFANGLMQDINEAYQALNTGKKTAGNPNSNSSSSLEEYLNFLRESSEISQIKGEWKINLPYWSLPATALAHKSQNNEPFLNIYVYQNKNNAFTISDHGENIKCLADFGHEEEVKDAKEHIKKNLFPVTLQQNALCVHSQNCESLGKAIYHLVETILWMDNTFEDRIHNWQKAEQYLKNRNKLVLTTGQLTETDHNLNMVIKSNPFNMNREGQKLHILMIPDPLWIKGEVKLTRLSDAMFGNESTLFKSEGFSLYEEELTAKDESWYVPEINVTYQITVSGQGQFILAAYKTM